MVIIENPEIKGSRLPCTVYFSSGEIAKRTFMNDGNYVGLRVHKSRKKYYPLSSGIYSRIDKIVIHNLPKEKTDVQRIIANGKRFLKLLDKRLWPELKTKVEEMLRNVIADYEVWKKSKAVNDTDGFSWWFWNKYHEEWIYSRRLFMTINTAFGNKFGGPGAALSRDIEKYLAGADEGFERASIRDTADSKSKYLYYSNQYGYDNHFEIHRDTKRAWLSKEFRGCGNGHYYLLISPTHAIHYEDD